MALKSPFIYFHIAYEKESRNPKYIYIMSCLQAIFRLFVNLSTNLYISP